MIAGLEGLKPVVQQVVLSEIEEASPGLGSMFSIEEPTSRRRSKAKGNIQQFARRQARQKFGPGHWPELKELVHRESGWNPQADNPTSSAYGLFQFLDDTWDAYGGLSNNPYKQIRKGLRYIQDRYGDPTGALGFHDSRGWY